LPIIWKFISTCTNAHFIELFCNSVWKSF
jgi:hypothetical protein